MTVTDYGQIIAALRGVVGVADADIEPDARGGMGLLRLGLAPGADEIEVATSVGRLLRERFGLGVDTERVRLVEDAGAETVPAKPGGTTRQRRPVIERMHLVSTDTNVTASVTLSFQGRTTVGEASDSATQAGAQRAAAAATLRGLEDLVGGAARFALVHVDVAATGTDRTVVAVVTLDTGSRSERLTGAAIVRDDARHAAIRATLDAVNRKLDTLLADRQR